MSHIKILCKGKLLESYPGFQKNFAALYPGVNILHIDDGFNHILTQIDQQQ
ncbi:hypothetical protein KBA84_01425 [Patescibacteria group bacterium]|nr:hypothetical protein [Patescibacteria group bacterium]